MYNRPTAYFFVISIFIALLSIYLKHLDITIIQDTEEDFDISDTLEYIEKVEIPENVSFFRYDFDIFVIEDLVQKLC
jgi:hypothetical protein